MRESLIFIIFATCFAPKLYKQSLKTEFVRLCQICTDVPPPIGVLGTVCGVIGLRKVSQSDVLLRLFDRGFGNGLRSIWVSEGVTKCCVSACFRVGFWKRSAGHLGFGGGRKVLCVCVFSSRVFETVCGAFGFRRRSQSALCLRVFERSSADHLGFAKITRIAINH